jgi:hypothetical protein
MVEIVAEVAPGLLDEPGLFEIVPPWMMVLYDLVLTRRSEPAADNAMEPPGDAALKPTPSLPPVVPGLLDEPGPKIEIVPPQNIATEPLADAAFKAMRESLEPDIVMLAPSLLSIAAASPSPPPTPSLPQPAPARPPAEPPARYGALTFRLADPVRFYRYLEGLLGEEGLFPPPAKPWRDGDPPERIDPIRLLAYLLANFDEQPSLAVFLKRARSNWPKPRYWVTRRAAQAALADQKAVDKLGPPKRRPEPRQRSPKLF